MVGRDLPDTDESSSLTSFESEDGSFFIEPDEESSSSSSPRAPRILELDGTKVDHRKLWEKAIRKNYRELCSNCGFNENLRVRMIVPTAAGGVLSLSNGVLLCRACDLARKVTELNSLPPTGKWPVNFWVSRALHDRIVHQTSAGAPSVFQSISALLRFLMSTFVDDCDFFDDLERYQDTGNEVKVNVWVERSLYEVFQAKAKARGWTVTDTLRALIRLYDIEAGSLLRKTKERLKGAPGNGAPLPTDSVSNEDSQ